MNTDLRKNPRFLATDGVPADIALNGIDYRGTIHNFSATGFAVVIAEELLVETASALSITFVPSPGKPEITIPAVVANQSTLPDGQTRMGCLISNLGPHANAYFSFLTSLVSKQGFITSMAKKPVKVRQASEN